MSRFIKIFLKIHHWLTHPGKIFRLKRFFSQRMGYWQETQMFETETKRTKEKPIILFSSCQGSFKKGDLKYNGGIKVYNLWIKLLRKHGYEAYLVTYDGKYQPWLIEHQSCLSLDVVREWQKKRKPLKFVTSWLESQNFINLAPYFYFIDCEIAYTSTIHYPLLKKFLKEKKIRYISTNSRFQQAWYMANFGFTPILITDWSDEEYWCPRPELREENLVGYMKESFRSEKEIKDIADICKKEGVELRFIEVKGDEEEVIKTMQRCDFYLGLNPGKHPLWGEGSPRSQQEAMHTGCIVIAYDVQGNREYIIDGYTGFLVPLGRTDLLARYLIKLSQSPDLKERVRVHSIEFSKQVFSSQGKWLLLSNFLELDNS